MLWELCQIANRSIATIHISCLRIKNPLETTVSYIGPQHWNMPAQTYKCLQSLSLDSCKRLNENEPLFTLALGRRSTDDEPQTRFTRVPASVDQDGKDWCPWQRTDICPRSVNDESEQWSSEAEAAANELAPVGQERHQIVNFRTREKKWLPEKLGMQSCNWLQPS